MKIYRLKAAIIGIPKLYRLIEISGNSSFADLHEALFDAFERVDPHLYSFFITRQDIRDIEAIVDAPEITAPENTEDLLVAGPPKPSAARTTLQSVALAAGDVFHYLFDFGDSWWHHLRVESVGEAPEAKAYNRLVESVGLAPRQYLQGDADPED